MAPSARSAPVSSLSPGLTSSRCPSGGRYRPSAAWKWTLAGIDSPVTASTTSTSTRRVGVGSDSIVIEPNRRRWPSAGSRPAGTSSESTAIVASGAIPSSTSAPLVASGSERTLPQPGIESDAHPPLATGEGAARSRNTWPRSTESRPSPPWIRSVRRGSMASGDTVPRKTVTPATTTAPPAAGDASGSIRRLVDLGRPAGDLDLVEPQGDVVSRARDDIGDPGLCRTPRAGQDPQKPRLSGRRVASRRLGRVGPAPVE